MKTGTAVYDESNTRGDVSVDFTDVGRVCGEHLVDAYMLHEVEMRQVWKIWCRTLSFLLCKKSDYVERALARHVTSHVTGISTSRSG